MKWLRKLFGRPEPEPEYPLFGWSAIALHQAIHGPFPETPPAPVACSLYRVMPYGTDGHRYPVYRGTETALVADFVCEDEAHDYAAYRNRLVDERGSDSLAPAAWTGERQAPPNEQWCVGCTPEDCSGCGPAYAADAVEQARAQAFHDARDKP